MGIDLKKLEETWDALAHQFRNWRGVRPRKSWFVSGLTERAAPTRLRLLEGGPDGKRFFELTKSLDTRDLCYLLVRAEINYEQAQAAARISIILNVTVIIGFIVLINQVFPGRIGSLFVELTLSEILFWLNMLIIILSVMIAVSSYVYGGAAMARDLKNLLELALARRDFKSTRNATDETGRSASVAGDFRQTFISDI